MKAAYPIIISKGQSHFIVYAPDFDINTQGKTEAEAMEMARDAIGIVGIDIEDEKEKLPNPTDISKVKKVNEKDIITLVDVDFTEYRRKNNSRSVKKSCTVPAWLAAAADKRNINYSMILQEALKQQLGY